MKKTVLNIMTSLMIAFVLSGCHESEVDKVTLIGKDKSFLESEYKARFVEKSPNSLWFGLEDKNAAGEQEPHTIGTLVNDNVEFSLVSRTGKGTFTHVKEQLNQQYGNPVATRDAIFDNKIIAGLECVESKTCNGGRYYEVFRGNDRFVMLQKHSDTSSEQDSITLMTITDKQITESRLERNKLKLLE